VQEVQEELKVQVTPELLVLPVVQEVRVVQV
jgi:hypothetical protein